jgi:hypothetical protein
LLAYVFAAIKLPSIPPLTDERSKQCATPGSKTFRGSEQFFLWQAFNTHAQAATNRQAIVAKLKRLPASRGGIAITGQRNSGILRFDEYALTCGIPIAIVFSRWMT